jgi:hypothetical protein
MENVNFETIANTLKNSGIAASMSDAIRMAKEMVSTGEKVQEDFQKRSEFMDKKLEQLKSGKTETKKPEVRVEIENKEAKEEKIENNDQEVGEKEEIKVDDKEDIIINENEISNADEEDSSLNEIMQEEAQKVYESKDKNENEPVSNEANEEEISVKEVDEQPEANVDLNEMFDFTKRPSE